MLNEFFLEEDNNEICKECYGTICTCPNKEIELKETQVKILYREGDTSKLIYEKEGYNREEKEEDDIPFCKYFWKDFFYFFFNNE